jgi:GMP synthase-like glutamine amidotransferase
MMGGPMGVNDDLPWIEPLCRLLRDAVDARVPVVGHCLGAQLLARAMDAPVTRAPVAEIGWMDVDTEGAEGAAWFGGRERFTTFEWHYDTFALPHGAQRVLSNATVPNQAYVLDGRHIGMQCHVEMTESLVDTWLRASPQELPATSTAARQSAADIRRGLRERVNALQAVATAVYDRWAHGLARSPA